MIAVPRSDGPAVSIVIIAMRNGEHLRACLESLERHGCDGLATETIVVLNGADADVTAVAREDADGVTVLDIPLNVGFAAAVNVARSAVRGDHIVLLHDDATVRADWLAPLVETAAAHGEAGAVGSLVLWPEGTVQVAGTIVWRGAEITILGEGDPPDAPEHQGLRAVDHTGSSSLLIPTATFDAVGGLDDGLYPAGWVDVTLCFAVRRLGQVVLVEPRSRAHHERGGTLGKDSSYRTFAYGRQRSRFVERFGADLDALPRRPPDPADMPGAIAAARERAAAVWARRAKAWTGPPPPAPPVTSPLATGGDADERLDAALGYVRRERALRDEWGREIEDRAARADVDNARLRIDRDRATEYARSLEVAREEAQRHAAALEAELRRRSEPRRPRDPRPWRRQR